jgi:hypothetical protein
VSERVLARLAHIIDAIDQIDALLKQRTFDDVSMIG